MPQKKGTVKDAFLQFAVVKVTTDAANSTVLVQATLETGLSIRGGLAWLIHLLEWFLPHQAATLADMSGVLCTVKGLTALPALGDKGVLSRADWVSNSASEMWQPHRQSFLPPVPIASPSLTLYAKSTADVAGLRGKEAHCRIGYTCITLDAALYQEIAEVWGW